MIDKNGIEYCECIVGNIIGKHYFGIDKEIKYGTKHFRPGTKVYCVFIHGGTDSVMVLGKPRKSFRMVEIILKSEYIKNFRLQKIYTPRIIEFIDKHSKGFERSTNFKWIKDRLNNSHIEIPEEDSANPALPF